LHTYQFNSSHRLRDDRKTFFEFFTVPIRNANTRVAYYRAIDQFLDWVERATTLIRSNGLISTTPNSIDLPAGIATPPIGVLNANFVLIFHFGLLGCFLQHLPIGIDLIRCCGILTKFAMRQYRAFLVTYKIA
jgi:hypothetical protein